MGKFTFDLIRFNDIVQTYYNSYANLIVEIDEKSSQNGGLLIRFNDD